MKLLLDMDGVLTDFIGYSHKWYGLSYSDDPKEYSYPLGEWDIDLLLPISQEGFWEGLTHQFWTTMPWTKDGKDLLQLLEETVGVSNITICTCPCQDPSSVSGKLVWIKKNIPQYSRNYMMTTRKELCAREDTVLIDDRDRNVERFREAGGKAILVPRLWNSAYTHAGNSLQHVKEELLVLLKKAERLTL